MYRGYRIPKGSIVMGNVWGITHDPTMYPDPMAFKPERYIAEDGTFDCSTNDPSRYVFGFGRRCVLISFLPCLPCRNSHVRRVCSVCPGKFFAEDLAWLTVAQFLAVMSVTIPAGCPQPKVEFVSGAISYVSPGSFALSLTDRSRTCVFDRRPAPFECDIRPRSDVAAQLIECCVRE